MPAANRVCPVRPVSKAKAADKPAPIAVYDESGKLIGVIMDPSKMTMLDDGSPDLDLTPVPPGEVGTPADAVGKSWEAKRQWSSDTRTAAEQAATGADMTTSALTAFSRYWAERTPGEAVDVAKRADAVLALRKGLYGGTDPVAQNRLAEGMNAAAITVFRQIRSAPPTGR